MGMICPMSSTAAYVSLEHEVPSMETTSPSSTISRCRDMPRGWSVVHGEDCRGYGYGPLPTCRAGDGRTGRVCSSIGGSRTRWIVGAPREWVKRSCRCRLRAAVRGA